MILSLYHPILLTTSRYHSHSELQRADGLYGGLVIHKRFEQGISEWEKYDYEDEQLLLIGDWYHRSAVDVQTSYLTFRSSGNEVLCTRNLLQGLPRLILISGEACSRLTSNQWAWVLQLFNGCSISASRVPRCADAKHEAVNQSYKIAGGQRRVRSTSHFI